MGTEFKEILKDFLSENNLSQTEFAKRINVKQSQVSEWLKGKCKPGYDVLKSIALAFDVSTDYLLGIKSLD
ncbi:MAG: helix-turn-helix transcriptional regulator [Clostridia bacterium]|nr:helix-turn-helix transcriptional regulator [Clostridia bacterium]